MLRSLNEAQIKSAVLQRWRELKRVTELSIIASEYVLGANGRRADLAILDEEFVGVEIKSDYDSLSRLFSQIDVYQNCFDKVIVVSGARHIDNCLENLGQHIEIWEITSRRSVEMRRPAKYYFQKNTQTMSKMVRLDKLRKITASKASRAELIKKIDDVPQQIIRDAIISSFRETYAETSNKFWSSIKKKDVGIRNVHALSRFAALRAKHADVQIQEAKFWESWKVAATNVFASTF